MKFEWISMPVFLADSKAQFVAKTKQYSSVMLFMLIFCIFVFAKPAHAATPLAVVKSDKTAEAYGEQHLGNFEEDWLSFKQTLETADVRYDLLTDDDLKAGLVRLAPYKVIVLPLLTDLPAEAVYGLAEFVKGGGKVLVTDSGGIPSQSAAEIFKLAGVTISKHTSMPEIGKLVWTRQPQPVSSDFSVGTLYANATAANGAQVVASWHDANGTDLGPAIVSQNGNMFFTWAPGVQGEITTNSYLMSLAMDDLSPGITQQAAVQISFADYQAIEEELAYLTKRTEEAIKTAKQADLAVPFKTIQQSDESALAHVVSFEEGYKARQFYKADDELAKARHDFAYAYAQSMPVRPVEARSVWLDRGTIISCRNAQGLSAYFDKLKAAGINVVYFECNNAGFTIYPSKVSTQNPEVVDWDPLESAVSAAHRRGMELHAWIWSFAVGNIRHNPIIGKEPDYPGPVLSNHDMSWALASVDGSLLPHNQPEYWLDPGNPDAREFVKSLAVEIVKNYAVDGLQLDYIRYPFNNRGTEMGFDWVGRSRFEQETGLNLDKLDDTTREVWKAWKIEQVNSLVRDISTTLKRMKPGFRLSAAVYAMPKRLRLNAIQQEWETWVANGWIDTLNPMTYVKSAPELANVASYVRESSQDQALVYPGVKIGQLDTAGLVEQLDTARAVGTLGTTIFACAQLDDKKLALLKVGPYRRHTLLTPQSEPIVASRYLMDDFAAMVNRYLQDPHKHILSDQASTNDIMVQIEQIQKELHELKSEATAEEIAQVVKDVSGLHAATKEWLRLEAFVQRGFRAQYIASYLSQVEAILSYASHRAATEAKILAGN
jgi:uncharacterized lipoprotein YddW (UPF0748 family)